MVHWCWELVPDYHDCQDANTSRALGCPLHKLTVAQAECLTKVAYFTIVQSEQLQCLMV